ncbi:hypothetical protein AB0I82_04135 [Streptomyces sp. NPDC050315]|uniref:hypothetical protein n=1 Tax=Streptomyces sp. NPDC050315 TaxID=3155039 RepID=UPI003415CC50
MEYVWPRRVAKSSAASTHGVLAADRLVTELRSIASRLNPRAQQLAAEAHRLLPPYIA